MSIANKFSWNNQPIYGTMVSEMTLPYHLQMEKGLVTGFYSDLSPALAHVDLAGIPLVDIPWGTQLWNGTTWDILII